MSGSTIGGVVGGVIGFFVGGPAGAQWGFMVGSAIGGYVDPMKVEGPRLKDARQQTSQDGVPIPFGYGTFPTAGNVIWTDELKEHKKEERQGKGGPKVTSYTYTRSYAIGICEGPIAGLLLIKRNGKVVWDAREPDTLREWMQDVPDYGTGGGMIGNMGVYDFWRHAIAWSQRFARKATFYVGEESQMPDPTIEAVEGIGNVPAHRGMAYMVVKDDDLTDMQGAIPQYEFVVASVGEVSPVDLDALAPGRYGRFVDAEWPLVDDAAAYSFEGTRGDSVPFSAATIEEVLAHFDDFYGTGVPVSTYLGYAAGDPTVQSFSAQEPQLSVLHSESLTLVYNQAAPDHYINAIAEYSSFCPLIPNTGPDAQSEYYCDATGALVFVESHGTTALGPYRHLGYCVSHPPQDSYFPSAYAIDPVYIRVTRVRSAPKDGAPEGYAAIPDAPGWYVAPDGDVAPAYTWIPVTGSYRVLKTKAPPQSDPDRGTQIAWWEVGPVLESTDPAFHSEAFWTAAYTSAVTAGDLPAGMTYLTDYPVSVSQVWKGTVDGDHTTIATDRVPLASIVADLCERAGLDADDYDVSNLADLVMGYKVATEAGADAMIAPLMPAYFFDAAEYDGKLRFKKRGGDATFSIGPDDLIEADGDAVTETVVQEAELLRKVTVGYLDPLTEYAPTTQKAERRSATVQARGESASEIPVVGSGTWAAQAAEKRLKVAWAETTKQEFGLPALRWARLTPTDVGLLHKANGDVLRVRVMRVEEDSGRLLVEASRDSQAAYIGTATGVLPPPPRITDPPLIGPTQLAVMNLPVLRDEDDDLGVYVAARGMLAGWAGATLQFSADGGATFTDAAEISSPATMGAVVSAIGAWVSPEYPSPQSMTVKLSAPMSSIDYASLLRYGNRAAVETAEGWEVLQFQTVTTNTDGSLALSGLVRGRYNTTPAAIAAGARFVLIDSAVQFVKVPVHLVGQAILIRAVPFGVDPDAITPTAYTLAHPASVREWPVAQIDASREASTVTVNWIPRPRIGVEVAPMQSRLFTGYRVTFSDGHSADVTGTSYVRADTPADVTVSVAPTNSITGAGPSSEAVSV